VLIVAQRVGTIMHADRIIVLAEGRIAGIGTHDELLETCDTYREIVFSQLSPEEVA
jgi:ATP-binding cassette subfamily B protein